MKIGTMFKMALAAVGIAAVAGVIGLRPAPGEAAAAANTTATGSATGPARATPHWSATLTDAMAVAAKTHKPVFIDFFATWCGPCKILGQAYQQPNLAQELTHWVPVVIDVDKNPDIAARYKVDSMPTLVFLSADGKELGRQVGFMVNKPIHTNAELFALVADETIQSMRKYQPAARPPARHKKSHGRHSR